ncbi:hypothetical protein C8J56DRAFT_817102 [Mycena floridula]|nr:hypothetical protein C8J56DRAFT_817102 [Mycena floridula]
MQSAIEFRPVSSSSSSFGFGFGIPFSPSGMIPTGWQPSPLSPGQAFHNSFAGMNPSPARSQKRKLEPEDDSENGRHTRDQSMDRSPTPERLKRAAPKRARVFNQGDESMKVDKAVKEKVAEENDVDVGVLLASIPAQSLLPLLNSLIVAEPSLKPAVLRLIPRPTLDTAVQALAGSAKKLSDAYPYSNSPSFPSFSSSSLSDNRPSAFGLSSTGFGRQSQQSQFNQASNNSGGMRESYIVSRLRPHINDFVAACMSYLPYFSCVPTSTDGSGGQGAHQSHSMALQALHKDKFHPSETYLFLAALTRHLLNQPPLTQASLSPLLVPRLTKEWMAWVEKVDSVVNRDGGMFGGEVVKCWIQGLDEFIANSDPHCGPMMQCVRSAWIAKVGWLVGRT